MKISHTLIHNGISYGIPEGTKVPEKPTPCTFTFPKCYPDNECRCHEDQYEYEDAIQAILSVAIQWEDQSTSIMTVCKQNAGKKMEPDTAYPLLGVEADPVRKLRHGDEGENEPWIDSDLPQEFPEEFEYRTFLRLIPQPNSEDGTNVVKTLSEMYGKSAFETHMEKQPQPNSEQRKIKSYTEVHGTYGVDEKKEPETRANYMEVARPMKCNACGYDATTFDFDVSYTEGITYTCRKCKAITLAIGMTFTTTGGVSEEEPTQEPEKLTYDLMTRWDEAVKIYHESGVNGVRKHFHIQKLKQ